MRETRRHPELPAIVGRQRFADPLAVGGGTVADIDGDSEQRARGAAHQLALDMGLAPEMQATNRADFRTAGFVVLHEMIVADIPGKKVCAEGFSEIAAFVAYVAGGE